MKKILFFITMMVLSIGLAQAQGKAEIKFDKTTHDFGTFSENNPVVSCTFKFTNIGDAPLVIHQAVASCGCTSFIKKNLTFATHKTIKRNRK